MYNIILYKATFVKKKRRIFMRQKENDIPFVPTEIHTKASEDLRKEIEAELKEKDPEKSVSSLKDFLPDSNEDVNSHEE